MKTPNPNFHILKSVILGYFFISKATSKELSGFSSPNFVDGEATYQPLQGVISLLNFNSSKAPSTR